MSARVLRRILLACAALLASASARAVPCGGPYVVTSGGPYTSINAALAAISTGSVYTSDCVVDIQDSSVYNETSSVTVQNIKLVGAHLIIGPQSPANHPSVRTVPGGIPIFRIMNASVTITGLNILTGNNTYAVQASSPNVIISSVIVSSSATGAQGVVLSSWSAVSYSTIVAGSGAALTLSGSVGTAITSCTISNNGASAFPALAILFGSSNMVTQSYIGNSGGGGYAMFINSSSGNVVTASTITSTGANGYALYNNGGSGDTFSGLSVSNTGGGSGIAAEFSSTFDEMFSQSTVTANSSITFNLFGGSSNTISQSVVQSVGGTAIVVSDAYDRVQNSTATAGSTGVAIELQGAYNTVSNNVFAANGTGTAVLIDPGANYNTVSQSTGTSTGGTGGLIQGNFNTIMQSRIASNASGTNALLISFSQGNSILSSNIDGGLNSAGVQIIGGTAHVINQSSITSQAQFGGYNYGLLIQQSTAISVVNSYVQGSSGVVVNGSTDTLISSSIVYSTNTFGSGVVLKGGSKNLTVTGTVIGGIGGFGPAKAGIDIQPNNIGSIVLSTNTVGSGYAIGVFVATQAAPASVWMTSNTILPGLATVSSNTYGVMLNGLTTGATIYNNTFVYRNASAIGNTTYGVWARSASGVKIDHNRIDNPGKVTGGTFDAIYLSNALNTTIKFNDIYAKTSANVGGIGLRAGEASSNLLVRDNIFALDLAAPGVGLTSMTVIVADAGSQAGFSSNYNDFFSSTTLSAFRWNIQSVSGLANWSALTGQDAISISADPLWADPRSGTEDFHPKSSAGRWNAGVGSFVMDAYTSQTVDAGDPTEPFVLEVAPNGARVNQGSYGNTADASRSPSTYPGCSVTAQVGAGQLYATIGAGVAALPPSLPGRACVVIMDSANYNEQVTLANFANNGSSITIFADIGQTPTVNPPGSSIAAFQILNASVSIAGLRIAPTASVAYGIYVSSPNVSITSVTLTDPAGNIATDGILLASFGNVAYSSVTVRNVDALYIPSGKNWNTVTVSSFSVANSGAHAVEIIGSSNTFTQCMMTASAGDSLALGNGATYNLISFSTMNSANGTILINNTANYNSISQSALSANTFAPVLWNYGSSNTIDSSALTANSSFNEAVLLNGSGNSLLRSSVRNIANLSSSFGLKLGGNSINVVLSSVVVNSLSDALLVTANASSITVTQSFLTNNSGLAAVIQTAGPTTISQSTVTGGIQIYGSTSTAVSNNYLYSPLTAAVAVGSGSVGVSLASNYVAPGSTSGFTFSPFNGGAIWIASNTLNFDSSGNGLSLSTTTPGSTVWVSSNLFLPDLSTNKENTALTINGLITGATIQFNSIYYRNSGGGSMNGYSSIRAMSSSGLTISHNRINQPNRITAGNYAAMDIIGSPYVGIKFNDINAGMGFGSAAVLISVTSGSTYAQLTNNVLYAGLNGATTATLFIDSLSQTGFFANYNDYFRNPGGGGGTALCGLALSNLGQPWSCGGGLLDGNSIAQDPLWFNVNSEDFHPRSVNGRWDPLSSSFVFDGSNSPTIDAGDPAEGYSQESSYNGNHRVNMGSYGDTAEASRSAAMSNYSGCSTTARVGSGMPYGSIASAVASLPSTLTGPTCVVVMDGGTYAEQVSISGFRNNGSSITVFADPASGATPTVTPPSGSYAAFDVRNSSVNISGIRVALGSSASYAIAVSSPWVTISSVGISDASGYASIAGILLTSSDTVAYATVSVSGAGAHALMVNSSASYGNVVTASSLTATGAGGYAYYISGASNTVAGSYLASTTGDSVLIASGSTLNTIRQSAMTGQINGIDIYGTSNTIIQSIISGATGDGILIEASASSNSVILSSVSATELGAAAIWWNGSSNSVVGCALTSSAGYAAYFNGGAAFNSISVSSLTTSGSANAAVFMNAGASSNTVSRSLIASSMTAAIEFAGAAANTVTLSTMSSAGGAAIFMRLGSLRNVISESSMFGQSAAAVNLTAASNTNVVMASTIATSGFSGVWINGSSSNVFVGDAILNGGSHGVYITSGSAGNLVSQTTVSVNGAGVYALYLVGSSSNTFASDYFSNSGSTAAYFDANANSNTLSLSTVAANGAGAAVAFWGASSNTITGSSLFNAGGMAVAVVSGSNSNALVFSSVSVSLGASPGILISSSVGNLVANSYVHALTTAVTISGSTGTMLSANVFSSGWSGVVLTGGSSGLTMTQNMAVGNGGSVIGLWLDAMNSGVLNLSTNTFLAGFTYAVYAATQASGTTLYIASNTFNPMAQIPIDSYGIYLVGASSAVVYNNSFYFNGSDAGGGGWKRVGLYALNASNLSFSHNRLNEPGLLNSNNSFYGVWLDATRNATVKFNDLNAAGSSIQIAYLLRLSNGATDNTVKNNIFNNAFLSAVVVAPTVGIDLASVSNLAFDNNDYSSEGTAANMALCGSSTYPLTASWTCSGTQDAHSISGNPLWLSTAAASEDFHPRSAAGRYTNSGFVNDAATSPTVDAGDAGEAFNLEPSPNGARVNLGSYGDTVEASKSVGGVCAVVRRVCQDGSCPSRTIQSAIDSIPNPLQGYSCVLVEDAGLYPENIVISGFSMSGSSLTVMLDPARSAHPALTPSAGTAAVLIQNSGVTFSGIDVAPTSGVMSYGIWASSANVNVSSVAVIDLGAHISEAAVAISSGVSVASATVYVALGTPHGISISGIGAVVSSSTIVLAGANGAANHYGVSLAQAQNASLVRLNVAMTNTGEALNLDASNGAAISLSTFSASSATAAGELVGSTGTTITQSYFGNSGGSSLRLTGSNGNTVSASTMAAAVGVGNFSMVVDGSTNAVARSVITALSGGGIMITNDVGNSLSSTTVTGSTAVYIVGAALTRVSNSVFNGLGGAGLSLDLGSDQASVVSSTLTNNSASSPSLLIQYAATTTVSASYVINEGSGNAVALVNTSSNSISASTMATMSLGSAPVYVNGASWNTFSRDYVLATSTIAMIVDANSAYNSLNFSTIAAAGGTKYGLYLAGAQNNSVIGSVITGGLWMDSAAAYNTVAQSTLTAVGINALALSLQTASANLVKQSYMANFTGTAVQLGGGTDCTQNAITTSVIVSSGAGATALSVSGASTNTFAGDSMISISGRAVQFSLSATSNTIVTSTITGRSATTAMDFASFSGSNSVTQSYVANVGGGIGVTLRTGSDANRLDQSTYFGSGGSAAILIDGVAMTRITQSAAIAGSTAVVVQFAPETAILNSTMTSAGVGLWNRSALDTSVSGSYVQGSTAVLVSGSTGTLIGGNSLFAIGGAALLYTGGNTGITVSSNVVQGGTRSQGLWFDETNSAGMIVVSTNIVLSGPQTGIGARALTAGSVLWITSNTIYPTLTTSTQTAGISLIALASGATVENNGIFYRTSGSMGSNLTSAIYAVGSSGVLIDHNRMSQPGMITAGNYVGVEVISSPGTIFKFNDVLGSGSGLGTPILLQVANSPNVVLKSNIFFNNMTASTANYTMALNVDNNSKPGFAADYNDFFIGSGGTSFIGSWGTLATHPSTLAGWRTTTGGDAHSIVGDPIWANIVSGSEDFHLKSAAVNGRYNPATGTFSIQDSTTSPAIDVGDPAEAFIDEPNPNGLRVNGGSYGGTAQASKSPPLAGCGTQATVAPGGGADYTSVNAALFPMIGTTLSADACIVLTQPGVDNEEIDVYGINSNGHRIIIMGHPALASRAIIDPGAGNAAAFVVTNDSVTIQDLDIIPSASLPYGIYSTSASMTLSDVNVDGGGFIASAGIWASSGATISYSSVTVQDATALALTGSGSSVTFSTAANVGASSSFAGLSLNGATATSLAHVLALSVNGAGASLTGGAVGNILAQSQIQSSAGAYALYINRASTNTISQSTVTNANGQGVQFTVNASYNTISASVLSSPGTAAGNTALAALGAQNNLVTGSFVAGGIWFDVGAARNSVSASTITASAAAGSAVYWQTASSNTLTQSYVYSAAGDAVRLGGGAANGANTIAQSTMTAAASGYYALELSGSSTNTISASVIRNPAGSAVSFTAANANTLSLSSITSGGGAAVLFTNGSSSNSFNQNFLLAASTGVEISGGSGNNVSFSTMLAVSGAGIYAHGTWATTVMNSYVEGSTAAVVSGSSGTVLGDDVFYAKSAFGIGVEMTGASGGLRLSSSTVYGGSQRGGLYLDAFNSGVIVISSNLFAEGSNTGVYISPQQAGTAIWFTSNTVLLGASGGSSPSGLNFNGLTGGATVSNNAFFVRSPAALGGATMAALSAQNSRGLMVDHNRFSIPGLASAGSVSVILLSGSDHSTIAFNDIYAADAFNALTSAYLLQLIASPYTIVRENVFLSSLTVTGSSATISVDGASQTGYSADYNDYFSSAGVSSIFWGGAVIPLPWSATIGQDSNSIAFHPRWASLTAGSEDFHPLSQAGRYVPGSGFNGGDNWTAGTLDAGDPSESFASEPSSNGSRVNLGSYGGTAEASKTPNPPTSPFVVSLASTSITVSFGPVGAQGQIVSASTSPAFTALVTSGPVVGQNTLAPQGLAPNTTYYLAAGALWGDLQVRSAVAMTSATLAASPAVNPGVTFTSVTASTIAVAWLPNGNPLDVTAYTVVFTTGSSYPNGDAGNVTVSTTPQSTPEATSYGSLNANTTYYVFVAALNVAGVPSAYLALGSTATLPAAPSASALTFLAASTSTVTVAWSANGNPVAVTTYTVAVSTDLTFSGALTVTLTTAPAAPSPTAQLGGLLANTTYYLRVKANGAGGADSGYVTLGSTSTWAAAPTSPVLTPNATDQITAAWSAPGNPSGTLYLLQTSTSAAFGGVVTSSYTYNLTVTTAGLAANTTYYFQALAIANDGVATAFSPLGGVATLANAPASATPTFTGVASASMSVVWSANGNPAGTSYLVVLSTAADFNAFASSVSFTTAPAAGPSATFGGLSPYTTYYFEAAAVNRGGIATSFTVLGSTLTEPPTLRAPGISGVTGIFATSMTAVWGLEPGATGYVLIASTMATNPPTEIWTSSGVAGTATTTATVSGLAPNTTYFLFVQSLSINAVGPYAQFAGTATRAADPTAAGTAFLEVGFTSATVAWNANANPLGVTTYTVTASTDPAFGVGASSVTLSTVPAAGPQAALSGLFANATYYFRVAAVGRDGTPTSALALGSTATAPAPPAAPAAFSAVSSNTISLSFGANSNILAVTTYTVVVSTAGDFNAFASSFVFSTAPAAGPSASLGGLTPNTSYYVGALTVGVDGTLSPFVVLGTTITAAQAPMALPLSSVATGQVLASWTAPANPAGTLYEMDYSTAASFTAGIVSSFTYNSSVLSLGLTPNTTYYFRAAAYNDANSPTQFTSLGSTSTFAAAPVSAPTPITMVGVSSVTLNWLASGNPLGLTSYVLVASTAPDFNAFASSVTFTTAPAAGPSTTITGLSFATSYYFEVAARGNGGELTAFASLGSTFTTLSNLVPLIVNNQLGDAVWRRTNSGVFYNVSFQDGSGMHLDKFQVKASTTPAGAGTDLIAFTDVAVNLSPADAYATPWSLPTPVWNALIEGVTNYITVRVFNNIPNSSTVVDAFYVRKDATAPTIVNTQSGDSTVRSSSGTVYSVSAYDAGSGLAAFQYSVSTNTSGDAGRIGWTDIALPAGASFYATPWPVNFAALLSGVTNYVSVRSWDIAGGTTTVLNAFYILKDTAGPVVAISTPAAGAGYVSPFGPVLGSATSAYPIQGTEIAVLDAGLNLYWNPGSGLFNSGSAVWMAANGQNNWSFDLAAHSISLTDGTGYKIVARSSTTFGQYSTSLTTAAFVFDASTPTAGVSTPAPNSTVAAVAAINGTALDPGTSASGVGSVEVQLERLTDGKWWNWFTDAWSSVAVSTIASGTTSWSVYPSALLQANLRSGTSYFIAVRAADNAVPVNQGNFFVSGSTFTYSNLTPPSAVSNLAAISGAAPGSVDLAWNATGETGSSGIIVLAQYALYYSTDGAAVPSTSTAQVSYSTGNVAPGTTSQYTLTGLAYGGTYYIWIAMQNADGVWSAFSNQASTIATPAPLNAILGHVVDISTNGITGVEIDAWDSAGALLSTTFTLADGSGTYAAAGLVAGTYKLQATWTVDGVTSSVWQDSIPMGSVNVDFSLNINYALATLTGSLASLTTPASRVATTPQSVLRPHTSGGASYVEVAQRNRTISRVGVPPSGRWIIPSLLPGRYAVRAFTGVDFTPYEDVTLMEGETKQITFAMDTLPEDQVFAFPNPAKNSTTFRFITPFQNFEAVIQIFDVAGRLVREIPGSSINSTATPGLYHADWDLTNLRGQAVASGVYLYLVKVKGDGSNLVKVIKKLAVVR